ncbi:MAG: FAD-binding oxidoreductase [Bacteroidota bacterium]
MSTTSLWQADTPAAPPPAQLPDAVDIAVVGGGVAGCAAAYWLRQHAPDLRVALVERGALASGASGRNAGFLLQGTAADVVQAVEEYGEDIARRIWAFTQENQRLVEALPAGAIRREAVGSAIAAASPDDANRLERGADLLADLGTNARYLDAAAANRTLGTARFAGALLVDDDGALDPVRLVRYLASESGATLVTHTPVEALEADRRGTLVHTARGTIRAERVVLALNAYAPLLVPDLTLFVRPVRAQMLATAPVAPTLMRPVYSHEGYYYVRRHADGRLLVGGARHLHRDEEVGYEDATTPALQADLEAYLAEHVPAVLPVQVERRWSGTMGFSPDGLPLVGALPGHPESRWCGGFTGHGMGFAVRLARLVVCEMMGEDDAYADLFAWERVAGPGSQVAGLDTVGPAT